jgi:hypothetical protein
MVFLEVRLTKYEKPLKIKNKTSKTSLEETLLNESNFFGGVKKMKLVFLLLFLSVIFFVVVLA